MALNSFLKGKKFSEIYILGKGESRSKVRIPAGPQALIISANDAALEIADIVVHTNSDLTPSQLMKRMKPDSLIFSTASRETHERAIPVTPVDKFELTSAEIVSEFHSPEITHLGYTILLCLRIAEEVSKSTGVGYKTYLTGFDFELSDADSQENDSMYVQSVFNSQERAYKTILSKKQLLTNSVVHVGYSSVSDMTPEVFNRISNETGSLEVGRQSEDQPVEIVAEITTNHFGDWNRLEQMVRRAKASGADSIKVQKRNPETFYSKDKLDSSFESPFGDTFREYRKALELDSETFSRLDGLCKEVGLSWFTSILDIDSFEFMMEFEPNRLKLPSTISEHTALLEHVSKNFKKEVVVSTGFTDLSYERKILDLFRNSSKLFLLQCVSAYPARNTETQIGVVRHYHDVSREAGSNVVPGYSSHDIGSLASIMAVAAGAKMLEKHVKLGDTDWAHFDEVAVNLESDDFARFTRDIREAQRIVGAGVKQIQKSEHHKYWVAPPSK